MTLDPGSLDAEESRCSHDDATEQAQDDGVEQGPCTDEEDDAVAERHIDSNHGLSGAIEEQDLPHELTLMSGRRFHLMPMRNSSDLHILNWVRSFVNTSSHLAIAASA